MRRGIAFPASRTTLRQRCRVAAVAAAALILAAGAVLATRSVPSAAAATATLTQVSNFGSNPGALQMYEYVPSTAQASAPLVVALHGCTQNATDYYSNSGWKQYADQWGFDIAFPQQTSSNNSSNCFDWWTPSDDSRGQGEAESIMQMIQYMESTYSINSSRIYITGLSAGGGMTSDMLADYPDVFAGGAIDSGLPAQCATSYAATTSCQQGTVSNTPAQWGALARNSDPGYSGPYPKVAIWQGTADYTVNKANATDEMDQWTNLWGISQTPSSTQSLTGGTTESSYNGPGGTPAVETYLISGMGHGLAVNPGSGTGQCGQTGAYFLNYICSSYYTALFWGLNSTSAGSPSPSPTPTTSPSPTPTPTPTPTAQCFTDNNYDFTVRGYAYQQGGYTYANGSNQNMGLWSTGVTSSLEETSPGYFVVVASCP
jgi:poly(hydroxyalkanoate) depolymerase family esterase